MKSKVHVLALMLSLALPLAAMAQDAPTPPTQEEPAKPPTEPAAPEPPAAPPKEEPAEPPAPKELTACAKTYEPLAESYKRAYEEMQKWLPEIDAKTAAASEQVMKLEVQIQENEKAATQAKLDGDSAKGKELSKTNKELWSQIEKAKKSESTACSEFLKGAEERVKKYAADAEAALDACKDKVK